MATKGKVKRVPRDSPDSSYNRLLDAAEALFAARGFYGTSMRNIADRAGIILSLTTYHFRSKDDLFNQVVLRRGPEHVANTLNSLDVLEGLKPSKIKGDPIEALIRAFVAPLVRQLQHGSEGWRNYIQLLARAVSARQDEAFLGEMQRVYDPVRARFVDLAKRFMPDADEEAIYWGTYFLNSALEHVLTENRSLDRLSHDRLRSTDFEVMLDRLVPFFAAGFHRLKRNSPD